MLVSIVGHSCYVYRQDTDPVFRPNRCGSSWSPPGWYGAESRLLHHVLRTLNARGYDLIKWRMWKDGHMVGTEHTQYLRSRNIRAKPSLCIYHADHALEISSECFNLLGRVVLRVEYGLSEECGGLRTAASMALVRDIDVARPVYEVSWDARADLDGGVMTSRPERYRHYRGFTDLAEARAFLRGESGESPRLIDRYTGKRLL